MKNFTQKTFGNSIDNAKSLTTFLEGFANYKTSRDNESITNVNKLISDLQTANFEKVKFKQNWSLSLKERGQLFSANEMSLNKTTTLIRASVIAQYGTHSLVAADILQKIRNFSSKKAKKGADEKEVKDGEASKSANVSHRPMSVKLELFQELVHSLKQLIPVYNPPNEDVSIKNLEKLTDDIIVINSSIDTNYAGYIENKFKLDTFYKELKETVSRIKNSVKCQYGLHSVEYIKINHFVYKSLLS